MLVLTPKYGSQIDIDLQKQKKEPLIKHRLSIDFNKCQNIKVAYLAFLTNKDKYFLCYKPKKADEINKFVKALGKIDTLDVSWIDISHLENLEKCFDHCQAKHIIGLEKWDVSNVRDMSYMFSYCKNLESIDDISGWNVYNVNTSMTYMFDQCENLKNIDLRGWNVSNVKYMSNMFARCKNLESIGDLRCWIVKNVKSMLGMFEGCQNLESIGDISCWNVSNIKWMSYMFSRCEKIKILDLSKWNIKNVLNLDSMFNECTSLESIGDISGWDVSHVNDMWSMFYNCKNLKNVGDIEQWNVPGSVNTRTMFENSAIKPIPSWYHA